MDQKGLHEPGPEIDPLAVAINGVLSVSVLLSGEAEKLSREMRS
jgi:hypothetical protein